MRITCFEIVGDLKYQYAKYRQSGQTRDQAVQTLMAQYYDELTAGAEDDGLLFWVGLADAQYALRELSDEVAVRGLAALEQLSLAIPEITPGDIEKRRRQYACAPMPERANIRKPQGFCCRWRIGDTFAFLLAGPEAEKNGLAGGYVLLRKVRESEAEGKIFPLVTLTHWKKAQLPSNDVEFQSVPILRLSNGRLDSPKSTYEYRIQIRFTSQKQVNELKLQYLGNFSNVPMPENEFFDPRPGCALMLQPRSMDEELNFYCYTLQNHYAKEKD